MVVIGGPGLSAGRPLKNWRKLALRSLCYAGIVTVQIFKPMGRIVVTIVAGDALDNAALDAIKPADAVVNMVGILADRLAKFGPLQAELPQRVGKWRRGITIRQWCTYRRLAQMSIQQAICPDQGGWRGWAESGVSKSGYSASSVIFGPRDNFSTDLLLWLGAPALPLPGRHMRMQPVC